MVMRGVICFVVLFLLAGVVAASSDVAYVYRSSDRIDENVLDVFSELGLSVDEIDEADLYGFDFSGYKMIFVGDERFRNEERIPVFEKPTVIANYYRGGEFGLTDYDGVSKLAGTEPLSVKKDGRILQVYTQAKYKLGGISIPYYYLDDKNKAAGMESAARTYTGGKNGYDFGDVISYAAAGTRLANGKMIQGNICFFGIIESNFWTAAARDMFEDCVGYVAMACGSDSDCPSEDAGDSYCSDGDVYQDVEEFECVNPGTVKSKCVDDLNSELVDDCGENYCESFGESYCSDGDVYRNRKCFDTGCRDSGFGISEAECYFDSYIDEQLVDDCLDVCIDGSCESIVCYVDGDCDDGDLYSVDVCENAGTPESYCDYEEIECLGDVDCDDDFYSADYCDGNSVFRDLHDFSCGVGLCDEVVILELVEECSDICASGKCVDVECYSDADCDDLDLYTIDSCENAGTPQSYCSHTSVNCINDNDCGATGFFGEEFCFDDDLFKNYRSAVCVNANTAESYCDVSLVQKNIVDCGEDEVGEVESYCFGGDVWVRQNVFSRGCSDESCFESVLVEKELGEDCGEDFYGEFGELYCKGDDVYKSRTFYDKGCARAECFVIDSDDEVFVGHCDFGCVSGECHEPSCGDGNLDFGEECDDGNVVSEDGCSADCLIEECVVDADCDDGLFCNGKESCVCGECAGGNVVICDVFDLDEVNECNGLYWDYFGGFDSVCSESLDACTTSCVQVVSECDFDCGAECVVDADCGCEDDYCDGTTLYDYEGYSLCVDCLCRSCGVEVILNSPECGYVESFCGDGSLDSGEECDDGNNDDEDGCSSNCLIEYECCEDEDCEDDYCGDWEFFCELGDVMKKRVCYDNFCEDGECSQKSRVEKKLFEKCCFGCEDGECIDWDCGGCDWDCGGCDWDCGNWCDWKFGIDFC